MWKIVRPGDKWCDGWAFGAMCEHAQAVEEGQIKKLGVACPPRHGKCARRGTRVAMADGSLVPIENVRPGDRVVSSDGVRVTTDVVTDAWFSGVKPLLRVTLSDGRMIEVTKDHRLFGWDTWITAGELKVGDPLCVAAETPCGENTLNRDDAFLLAMWVAEGTKCVGNGTFQVTTASAALVERMRAIASDRGWTLRYHGRYHYSLTMGWNRESSPIAFLRHYEMWNICTTHTASVPRSVMAADFTSVCEFIGVYISCDGFVSRAAGSVGVSSVSERLVRDFQHLFTKISVRSTVIRKKQTYRGETRYFWECLVSSKESLEQLSRYVEIPDKQHKLIELVAQKSKTKSNARSIPPAWRKLICGTARHVRDVHGIRIDKAGWTDAAKVRRVAELTNSRDLRDKSSSGLSWRRVVSIEEIGSDETYDIETRTHHAFFANGILAHNSIVFNVLLPTWTWTRNPWKRFIYTSYSQTLSRKDSITCREVIRSRYFADRWGHLFQFKEDQNTQSLFGNDKGGYRIATTVGGMGTGEGADIIVADDITSVQESFSSVALETAWRYWTQTMTTRFHDPEAVARVVTMQRTRRTDLLGRLIAENFGYEILTLPFEAEPHRIYFTPAQKAQVGIPRVPGDDVPPKHAIVPTSLQLKHRHLRDTRQPGEVLWPERFTNPETVKDLKKSVQAGQAGQLQQRPEEDAGSVFKASKYKLCYPFHTERGIAFMMDATEKPRVVYADECLWYQTCDTAMKEEQQNDPTAFATFAKSPYGDLIIYDVTQERLLVPEQWPAMKQMRSGRAQWSAERREWAIEGRLRPWPRPLVFQSVEEKNSGIGLLQIARSEHYVLKVLEADTNKTMRAATAANLYESGQVYHNAEGLWRDEVEDQLSSFPTGLHDDAVDCIAYGAILFIHDVILRSFDGPLVYNEAAHAEVEAMETARKELGEGKWIPPHLRPQTPEAPEDIESILATLRGRPKEGPPIVDDDGRIALDFLNDEE